MRSCTSLETEGKQTRALYSPHLEPSVEKKNRCMYSSRSMQRRVWPSNCGSCTVVKRKVFVRMLSIYSVASNVITNRKREMWEMDRIRVSEWSKKWICDQVISSVNVLGSDSGFLFVLQLLASLQAVVRPHPAVANFEELVDSLGNRLIVFFLELDERINTTLISAQYIWRYNQLWA